MKDPHKVYIYNSSSFSLFLIIELVMRKRNSFLKCIISLGLQKYILEIINLNQ